MARKARQRISYVLPLANSAGGHRLGVNGLAIDGDTNTLYSGGRDGVICAWDLNLDLYNPPRPAAGSNDKPPALPATTFRRQVQAHTHWINDIILTHTNQALVSASSDVSVKIWRPAAQDSLPPQTIGLHNDYVKVLACPDQHTNWVASGGLDRKICLWDTSGAGQRLSIDVGLEEGASGLGRDKGSVYALDATHAIIGSGGPESVVRMWDPRSGKRITKFVGHTDNVRDVLISDDSSTVMTASSDQTVKLWSVTAGRCMNTFTMHDASVWSLWSDHPQLSVFYSSDRSGLIAKTDTRGCAELEEGLSVAVCLEHQSVQKVIAAGDFLWTATSRPSINRWRDVDTDDAEIESPEGVKMSNRLSFPTTKSRLPSPPANGHGPQGPHRNSLTGANKISSKHVLRLSNTAYLPHQPRPAAREGTTVPTDDAKHEELQPVRNAPESHIEGQSGLIKHVMLSDRRRVLTLDTAGEVIMWDLIKCQPLKSFGKRHIEDVTSEVNTLESVPNWCTVDTRTGSLTITLEENNAFDAEMYADELATDQNLDFKEDQRINLGKWVLRYLFANLIDEEIRRDQQIRRHLLTNAKQQKLERQNAPTSIKLPALRSNGWHDSSAPPTASTLKGGTANTAVTPGLLIGQATPGGFFGSPAKARDSTASGSTDEEAPLAKTQSHQSQQGRKSIDNKDYFSTAPTGVAGLVSPTETVKAPLTPSSENPPEEGDAATALPTDTPSKFGRKFGMKMSFNMKKLTRTSTAEASKPPAVEENTKESEGESDSHSLKTDNSRVVDENFLGCVQKIRFGYEDELAAQGQRQTAMEAAGGALGSSKELDLPSQITPSLPNDTPVLKPPGNTTILIQEDRPEAGGVADLWEGKVSSTGEAANVDLLEKCAPMWLGDVLLKNQIPVKDIVKISFILEPWRGLLPAIASEGNNRLNANRMLRARKILSYVSERIEPASDLSNNTTNPAPTAAPAPTTPLSPKFASNNPYASHTSPTPSPRADNPFASDEDEHSDSELDNAGPAPGVAAPAAAAPLRPDEYLELYCNNQLVPPTMTLATIRAHIWKSGGDVLLTYKANGRKKILHQPQVGAGTNGEDATAAGAASF